MHVICMYELNWQQEKDVLYEVHPLFMTNPF